jgi:hypothetical protein
MPEPNLGLALKPQNAFGIVGKGFGQNFDRDFTYLR